MAAEKITIARPYAEAAFNYALEHEALNQWSAMLKLSASVVEAPGAEKLFDNPRLTRAAKSDLLLDLAGTGLSEDGKNFIRLIVLNNRTGVIPEIYAMYEQLKKEHQRVLDVEISTAYPVDQQQQANLEKVLEKKLGKRIQIVSSLDPSLIGGLKIRAGDLVIDGSIKGQVSRLAADLGI